MKKILYLIPLLLLLAGCTKNDTITGDAAAAPAETQNPYLTEGPDGSSILPDASFIAANTDTLLEAESAGLLFMREEEKLARDVYAAMYEKYRTRIFLNISRSEQVHTTAIKNLLRYYGIPDPAAGTPPGVFVNPALQALYTRLINRGNVSLREALLVGKAIEEIDIADLNLHIAEAVHAPLVRVYSNLKAASCAHLRAFNWQLQNPN